MNIDKINNQASHLIHFLKLDATQEAVTRALLSSLGTNQEEAENSVNVVLTIDDVKSRPLGDLIKVEDQRAIIKKLAENHNNNEFGLAVEDIDELIDDLIKDHYQVINKTSGDAFTYSNHGAYAGWTRPDDFENYDLVMDDEQTKIICMHSSVQSFDAEYELKRIK